MRFLVSLIYAVLLCQTATAQHTPIDTAALSAKIEAGDYGAVSSLWIERGGEVLYENYFRGTNTKSLHNMRSVGKTVSGMLLGAAIDDGHIDTADVKAASYFGELRPFRNPDPRKEAITLKHLLTMSSGLECDDFNNFSRGNEERMYLVEDWSKFYWDLPIKNRPSWEIEDVDARFDRYFRYCTAGAQLIGEVVERATSISAPDYAQDRLFAPLGITSPKWNYASSGTAHLGGGLELKTRDWAALGRLLAQEGQFNGEQILPKAWAQASMTSYVQADESSDYGYFLWRPHHEIAGQKISVNAMSGMGGNYVYILPDHDVVVVLTKNNFRARGAHDSSKALFENEVLPLLAP